MHLFHNEMSLSLIKVIINYCLHVFYCLITCSDIRRIYWTDFEVIASHEIQTCVDSQVTYQYCKVTGQIVSCGRDVYHNVMCMCTCQNIMLIVEDIIVTQSHLTV